MSFLDPKPEILKECEVLAEEVKFGLEILLDKDDPYHRLPILLNPPHPQTREELGEYKIKKACEILIGHVIDSPLISVESEVELKYWSLQVQFTFTLVNGLKTVVTHKRDTQCVDLGRGSLYMAALTICHSAIGVALQTERWLMNQMFRADEKTDYVDAVNFMFGKSL